MCYSDSILDILFFFFQAEDGIRYLTVTGVQTCALPISAELIGMTPRDFFRHDIAAGRRGWRKLFDAGHTHSLTNERRLDGSMMWVEGDYMCFYEIGRAHV